MLLLRLEIISIIGRLTIKGTNETDKNSIVGSGCRYSGGLWHLVDSAHYGQKENADGV